jgi:Uma2 family endonuclease
MALQTALNIADKLPATFTAPGLTEAEFLALRDEYPDCFLEYTADGTVIIMPPTDPESGMREAQITQQLATWASQRRGGIVTSPSAGFRFPDGSRRSPDAAWFDAERWRAAKTPRTRFPVFAPEFVIEVRSPDDRLRLLREKMDDYMSNGVQLAWLIDPFARTVTIYRPGRTPEVLENPGEVAGEGPVAGFILKLEGILTG